MTDWLWLFTGEGCYRAGGLWRCCGSDSPITTSSRCYARYRVSSITCQYHPPTSPQSFQPPTPPYDFDNPVNYRTTGSLASRFFPRALFADRDPSTSRHAAMAPITDEDWADLVAHELPKTSDPVVQKYLESRRALVAEEGKHRSGTIASPSFVIMSLSSGLLVPARY